MHLKAKVRNNLLRSWYIYTKAFLTKVKLEDEKVKLELEQGVKIAWHYFIACF